MRTTTLLPLEHVQPIMGYMHQYYRAVTVAVEVPTGDGHQQISGSARAIKLINELARYHKHTTQEKEHDN